MNRTTALAVALALSAGAAHAHAFRVGADAYALFVEGMAVPWSDPWILFGLLPFGVLAGIWRMDGMPLVWPALIGGLIVGFATAPLMPEGLEIVPLAIGLIAAALGALARDYAPEPLLALMALGAVSAGWVALAGHGYGELPLTVYAGIFLGAQFAVVLPAALVVATRRALTAGWLMIGWRVAASWLGAIAMILGAFRLA